MNLEENRLASFETWPSSDIVDPVELARAGFYYVGKEQQTRCFECAVAISDWKPGDQPMDRHREAQPGCRFVLNPQETINVPSTESENSTDHMARLQQLNSLSQRLATFADWPASTPVSSHQLARSGFYYLGHDDVVQCIYCKGVLSQWKPEDDPDQEHRLHFPNCDFYTKNNEEEELLIANNEKLINSASGHLDQLGMHAHTKPAQPKCATYESRLKTFEKWPKDLKQTPEMLAAAGFYYIGQEDCVRCFHCDGGLVNWEANDDAWVEHARWFPKCSFVAMVQGQEFIKLCIENRPPLETSIHSERVMDPSSKIDMPSTSFSKPSTSQTKKFTDSELDKIVFSATAIEAVKRGLSVQTVKMTIKKRLEETGIPYSNADELIENAHRIIEDETRPAETVSRALDSLPSDLAPVLNLINNEQCNSITHNHKEQIPHSSQYGHSSHDAITNGETDDSGEENQVVKKQEEKSNDAAFLLEEIRRLKEARLCKICMDREVTIVLLPCGHLVTCVFCVPSLTHCPICRENIRATIRTFLA